MHKRMAGVNHIRVNSVSFSSIFSIGDTINTNQKSKGIAVQKEGAVFTKENDLNFCDYPIFKREANWPKQKNQTISKTTKHNEEIHVKNTAVTGISTSSIFQVGSIDKIAAESRIKHFRKLQE